MKKDWVEATIEKWRARAAVHRRHGGEDIALAMEACADELESIWNESLTVCDAAGESGYDAETVYDLVVERTIPNAGSFDNPRIRRRDIPIRPGRDKWERLP